MPVLSVIAIFHERLKIAPSKPLANVPFGDKLNLASQTLTHTPPQNLPRMERD